MALTTSHAPPPTPNRSLDASLRDYLETNDDVVTHITKPVKMAHIPALIGQSEQPIVFEDIVEKPGFRLADILVKHRHLQARALGVPRDQYLKTLAYRLRKPPRGFVHVKDGPVKEVKMKGKDVDWTKLPVPIPSEKETRPYVTAMNIVVDLERMADHATNISQRVTYIVTGKRN